MKPSAIASPLGLIASCLMLTGCAHRNVAPDTHADHVGETAHGHSTGQHQHAMPQGHPTGHAADEGPGKLVRFDFGRADDPDWLIKACDLHGHLGPWVTLGALVGEDAKHRLHANGFDLQVVYNLPADRRTPPQTCLVDGLQSSTGATLGKGNIAVAWRTDVTALAPDDIVIFVVRRAHAGQPAQGFAYRANAALLHKLRTINVAKLADESRAVAKAGVVAWFDVTPLTAAQLARL